MSGLALAIDAAVAKSAIEDSRVRISEPIPWLEGRVARYLRGAVLDVKAPGEQALAPVVPGATVHCCDAPDVDSVRAAASGPTYDAIFARYLLDAAVAPVSVAAALFQLLRSNGHLVLQVRCADPASGPEATAGAGQVPPAKLWSWSSADDVLPLLEQALPDGAYLVLHCDFTQARHGPLDLPASPVAVGHRSSHAVPQSVTLVVRKLRNQATHRLHDTTSVARATLMPSAHARISFLFPSPATPRASQMVPDGPLLVRDYRSMAVQRILVLKLDHHGDFIIGLPALRQLRHAFPDAHIRLICGSWNLDTARRSGLADEVRSFNFFPERSAEWSGAPFADWHEFNGAAEGRFDLAIDLRVDEDTRYLLHHVDATLRCGIGSQGRHPMLDVALPMGERDVIFPAHLDGTNSLVNPDGTRRFGLSCFESRMPVQTRSFHQTNLRGAAGWLLRSERFRLLAGRYEARLDLAPRRFLPTRSEFGIKTEVLLGQQANADPGSGGFVRVAERVIGRRSLLLNRVNSVTLEFNVLDSAYALMQVSAEGTALAGRLRFTGANLRRLNPDGARFRPSELHVGEKLSLLVNLIQQRVSPGEISAGKKVPSDGAYAQPGQVAIPHGKPDVREVVIAPFSNSEIRDWPAAHYAELIRLLVQAYGCKVRLVGTQAQRAMADRLCGLAVMEAPGNLIANDVGRTGWTELSAILRGADLVICNNSGVAHRAAEEGCRTLAIYSASHQPGEWGPRGVRSRAIMMGIRCSPCGYERLEDCPNDHVCMQMLTPAMVMPHVEDLLART